MASLSSLVVSLGLDAADFTSGLTKSEYLAKQFADRLGNGLRTAATAATAALAAAGAGAAAAAIAIDKLAKDAAQFKDLEETTGASAESLASFAVAAGTADVSMESVAASTQKLTKNLVGVDDESKAAGAALKAINIDLQAFKELDPAAQYEAVGKALAGYADDAGKVAVAQAIFGKSGAEQLKVFKALEEQGGRQVILTQQQIEAADAYADRQAKATAQLRLYAQSAATEALPAIDALTTAGKSFFAELVGIDEASGRLAANSAVKDFANGAADTLAFIVDAGRGVVQTFQAIGTSLGAGAAAAAAVARGEIRAAIEIARQARADIDQILSAESFRDKLAKARATAETIAPKPDLPRISFEGAIKPERSTRSAKSVDEAQRYLERLQQQLQATKDLSVAETVLADIQAGRLGKVSAAQQESLLGVARQIDAAKEQKRAFELQQQAADEAAESQRALTLQGIELYEQTRTPVERLNQELERLNGLLAAGVIDMDTFARAQGKLFADYDDTFKGVKEQEDAIKSATKELGLTFSSAFEDAIVSGNKFSDILKGLEQDIVRIITRKAITEPLANGITDFLGGLFKGGGGSGFGGIFSAIGSFFGFGKAIGGPVLPGTMYEVNERRPEVLDVNGRQFLMMGSQRGNVIPNPRLGGNRTVNQSITINVPETTTRASATQLAAEIQRRLSAGSRNL